MSDKKPLLGDQIKMLGAALALAVAAAALPGLSWALYPWGTPTLRGQAQDRADLAAWAHWLGTSVTEETDNSRITRGYVRAEWRGILLVIWAELDDSNTGPVTG